MNKLSTIIAVALLSSCANNIFNFGFPKISDNIQILKMSLINSGANGVATDVSGNTYIASTHGQIFKINSLNDILEFKNNNINIDNLGSFPNLFFHVDTKGNGYLIPTGDTITSFSEDPITKKIKAYDNKFIIYKISNF